MLRNTKKGLERQWSVFAIFIRRLWLDHEVTKILFWWFAFGVVLYACSILLDLTPPIPREVVAFLFGSIVTPVIMLFHRKHGYRRACDGAFEMLVSREARSELMTAIVVLLSLVVLWLILLGLTSAQPVRNLMGEAITKNPGGMFALLTGIATLIGTIVAIQSIINIKQTITSFDQLVDRISNLINESQLSNEGACFLALTPLTGKWNVSSSVSKRLEDALYKSETKVRMICLEKNDHIRFLNAFLDKETGDGKKITSKVIEGYADESEKVLAYLAGKAERQKTNPKNRNETIVTRKAHDCIVAPVRLTLDKMPGAYFFVSASRAIVVFPAEMPRPDAPSPTGSGVRVATLGFESTDRQVIHVLAREFERYWLHIGSPSSAANDESAGETGVPPEVQRLLVQEGAQES